jgi:hypothetical protein
LFQVPEEDADGGDSRYVTTIKSLLSDDEFGSLDDDDLAGMQ